jgi:hypothetical protein
MSDRTELLAAEGERGAITLANTVAHAGDDAFEALFDGILRGASVALIRRFGTGRAYQIIQAHADALDRVLLNECPPQKPTSPCGQI